MSEFENKSENSSGSDAKVGQDKQTGRRKFLKGTIAASPVLLTVANRPVWARNCSLSGELSGNLSHQDDTTCGGEGCTKGYWGHRGSTISALNPGGWHPDYPPEMAFNDAFGCDVFPGKSLIEIIHIEDYVSNKHPHDEYDKQAIKKEFDNLVVNTNGCLSPNELNGNFKHDHSAKMMILKTAAQAIAALQNAATSLRYKYMVHDTEGGGENGVIPKFYKAWLTASYANFENLNEDFDRENNTYCPFG